MDPVANTFLPSSTYNTLPTISQVAEAPESHAQDLQTLLQLLEKHNVPKGVSVRLIHKHFDTTDGEIMVFDKVTVPEHGVAQIMKPIIPTDGSTLQGVHYFVDENAGLKAYEYTTHSAPDLSGHDAFFADFCKVVSERGLQRIFGLKLQHLNDSDTTGWTEYEIHSKRGTIMFPDGMPMPDGESDFSVTTEWEGLFNERPKTCKHSTTCKHGNSTCKHCRHCNNHDAEDNIPGLESGGDNLCLGGQKIVPGTAVHHVVHHIIAAF